MLLYSSGYLLGMWLCFSLAGLCGSLRARLKVVGEQGEMVREIWGYVSTPFSRGDKINRPGNTDILYIS
jgi:hypothetical protein